MKNMKIISFLLLISILINLTFWCTSTYPAHLKVVLDPVNMYNTRLLKIKGNSTVVSSNLSLCVQKYSFTCIGVINPSAETCTNHSIFIKQGSFLKYLLLQCVTFFFFINILISFCSELIQLSFKNLAYLENQYTANLPEPSRIIWSFIQKIHFSKHFATILLFQ